MDFTVWCYIVFGFFVMGLGALFILIGAWRDEGGA
jgi:hypothetical protein